jgi:hypothetical protein
MAMQSGKMNSMKEGIEESIKAVIKREKREKTNMNAQTYGVRRRV